MPRNKLIYLLATLMLLPPTVNAQNFSGPREALSYVEGLISEACKFGGRSFMGISVDDFLGIIAGTDVRSLLYVCDYQNVLSQAERATSGILRDLDQGGEVLGRNIVPRLLSVFDRGGNDAATEAAAERIETVREELYDPESETTVADYRDVLIEEIDAAEQRAIAEMERYFDPKNFSESSAAYRVAQSYAANPAAQAQALNHVRQSAAIARQAVLSDTTYEASLAAADAFIADDSYQDLVISTIEPYDAVTGEGGAAGRLASRANLATSTREAVNELSQGWADYMRQDAILTSSVIEGLKSVVTQQSLTNAQLKNEADRLYNQQFAMLEQQRVQREEEMLIIAEDFTNTVDILFSVLEADNVLFQQAPPRSQDE